MPTVNERTKEMQDEEQRRHLKIQAVVQAAPEHPDPTAAAALRSKGRKVLWRKTKEGAAAGAKKLYTALLEACAKDSKLGAGRQGNVVGIMKGGEWVAEFEFRAPVVVHTGLIDDQGDEIIRLE